MSISTYSELQTAIANWLKRTDLTSRIPEYIQLAEVRINQEIRAKEMKQRATATAKTTTRWNELPDRFLDMHQLELTYSDQIWFPAYVAHDRMKDFRNTTTGQPTHFTTWGLEMAFERVPDEAYTMEMVYYRGVAALSGSNTTNEVLTNYPNVYLYAALIEAAVHIRVDPEHKATWIAAYTDAKDTINQVSENTAHVGPLRRRVRV